MALRLKREDDLLDIAFRSKIIQELDHQSNIERKSKMFRRHDMYRDNTKAYVAETIKCEQGDEALAEIQHRISNISLLKVVINKKSMVYASGAKREVIGDEKSQAQIDQVIELLNFNSCMKKANRWEELFKNAIVQIYPYKNDITQKWRIKLELNLPYKIDVLEDENNNEESRCYIYSYFVPQSTSLSYAPVGQSGVHSGAIMTGSNAFDAGAGVNQRIQDELCADEKREYIWWSTKYHFTTDEKGAIINENVDSVESVSNPVTDIPYVNISTNQDGNFWAVGGEDLVDGSMLVNLFLTEIYYIAKYQGMGLFYLFGRGVPKRIKVGPSQALTLDVKPDDPTPQIGFASSNPNISEYMNSIKEYIAALMKTNKLEPASVMGFESVMQASSGFQELLQKSELYETLEDAKETYRDAEPLIFKKYIKWHNFLLDKGLLDDEFAQIGRIDENIKIVTKFYPAQSTMTEKEKLEVIKMRQEIGLDTMVDSLMKDNTELTREAATEKALEILKQKTLDARAKMIDSFKVAQKDDQASEGDEPDDMEESDEEIEKEDE